MNSDMSLAMHWPAPVNVHVRVSYGMGPADTWRLRLDPAGGEAQVRTVLWGPSADAPESKLIDFAELPGRTTFARCLSVLAVHLFGSTEMPARVFGPPLWHGIVVELTLEGDEPQTMQFELHAMGNGRGTLKTRLRRDQPAVATAFSLEPLDADPLRALLRVGLTHIKPTVARKTVSQRAEGLQQPTWAEGVLHAPELVN